MFLQVVVHITDENDCTPEFMHSIYSRDNVPETTPPGTSLLQGEWVHVSQYQFMNLFIHLNISSSTVRHKRPMQRKNYWKVFMVSLSVCSLFRCICLSLSLWFWFVTSSFLNVFLIHGCLSHCLFVRVPIYLLLFISLCICLTDFVFFLSISASVSHSLYWLFSLSVCHHLSLIPY